jgi:lipid-binding SYLF domain-containing protein
MDEHGRGPGSIVKNVCYWFGGFFQGENEMNKSLMVGFMGLLLAGLALAVPVSAQAQSAAEINAKVNGALAKFRTEVAGADEYLKAARAVLVVPEVRKVGFVVAAQWGKGALLMNGLPVEYYKMEAGSAGFQGGYQKADFIFIFFTDHALQKFRSGAGFEIGAESGFTVVDKGAGIGVDTLKSQNAVAAFAVAQEGLMAGWSAKGTKFTRINP